VQTASTRLVAPVILFQLLFIEGHLLLGAKPRRFDGFNTFGTAFKLIRRRWDFGFGSWVNHNIGILPSGLTSVTVEFGGHARFNDEVSVTMLEYPPPASQPVRHASEPISATTGAHDDCVDKRRTPGYKAPNKNRNDPRLLRGI
jgi:hypothetical protein